MTAVINQASSNEAREITEVFYQTWLATYPDDIIGVTEDDIRHFYKDPLTDEGVKKMADNIATMPANKKLWVAKEGDKIVGVCRVTKSKDGNKLNALYVLPAYQGRGIGKKLCQQAFQFLGSDQDIFLGVAIYNDQALGFYKKLGFVDTGRRFSEERFRMKSGALIQEMEMVLKFKT